MVLIADAGRCFPSLPLLGEYCEQAAVHPGMGGSRSSQAVSALFPGCHTALKQERAEQKAGKGLQLRASPPAWGAALSCPARGDGGQRLPQAVPAQGSAAGSG